MSLHKSFSQGGWMLMTCLLLHSTFQTLQILAPRESTESSAMNLADSIFALLAMLFLGSAALLFGSAVLSMFYTLQFPFLSLRGLVAGRISVFSASASSSTRTPRSGNMTLHESVNAESSTIPESQQLPLLNHEPGWEYQIALEFERIAASGASTLPPPAPSSSKSGIFNDDNTSTVRTPKETSRKDSMDSDVTIVAACARYVEVLYDMGAVHERKKSSSKAVDGFEHKSLPDYSETLRLWAGWLDDCREDSSAAGGGLGCRQASCLPC